MSGSTFLDLERYMSWQLSRLLSVPNRSSTRAALANLRRGVGKPPGSIPDIWTYTLEGLGEKHSDWLSRDGIATKEEWAIHLAMTHFALHQQGKEWKTGGDGVYPGAMHQTGVEFGLGRSVLELARNNEGFIRDDDFDRIKKRFDILVTSNSITELAHHLRSMITLLARKDIPLDYVRLAKDLNDYQVLKLRDRVRLRWGQDFYWRKPTQDEELEEREEK